MSENFPEDLTLKPWVRNLIELYNTWRNRMLPSWTFWILSGDERLFRDLQKIKEVAGKLSQNPLVYYIGIGNISRVGIDLIYPLIATNFSKLIAVDIEPREEGQFFERFIQAVTLNLSLIDEIDQEEIYFERINENKFKAVFTYEGTIREVYLYIRFDARLSFPEELKDGYQAFFTRRTDALFTNSYFATIPHQIKNGFLNYLNSGGLVVFQEIVGDKRDIKMRIRELLDWLGKGFESHYRSDIPDSFSEKLMCFRKK